VAFALTVQLVDNSSVASLHLYHRYHFYAGCLCYQNCSYLSLFGTDRAVIFIPNCIPYGLFTAFLSLFLFYYAIFQVCVFGWSVLTIFY